VGRQLNGVASLDFVSKNGLLALLIGGATLCYEFDQYKVNACVQNKTAL